MNVYAIMKWTKFQQGVTSVANWNLTRNILVIAIICSLLSACSLIANMNKPKPLTMKVVMQKAIEQSKKQPFLPTQFTQENNYPGAGSLAKISVDYLNEKTFHFLEVKKM